MIWKSLHEFEIRANWIRCLVPFLRGSGATCFLSLNAMRTRQQAALTVDPRTFMDALAIRQAILGGYDRDGRAPCTVSALRLERVLMSCGQDYVG